MVLVVDYSRFLGLSNLKQVYQRAVYRGQQCHCAIQSSELKIWNNVYILSLLRVTAIQSLNSLAKKKKSRILAEQEIPNQDQST